MRVPGFVANPLLRTFWEKLVLPGILRDIGADVYFCPGGLMHTRVPKKCRTVTMFRNMIPFDMRVRKLYPPGAQRIRNWLLERAMLASMQRCNQVIFISKHAREIIERLLPDVASRAITIPHGIDDNFRIAGKQIAPRPSWLPAGEYLLYVSLFEVYKHQLEVVRGYHLLKSRRRTPEKLVLAGTLLEPAASRVRAEIDRLGLHDDIFLVGNIPYLELPAVYAGAKVNIFASTCENCPNILLEAMGSGRPMLVSDHPPMPEFAGDAAIYYNAESPEDFADKLTPILDDPVCLEHYACLTADRSALYNWRETAERTWNVIRELGHGQSPG